MIQYVMLKFKNSGKKYKYKFNTKFILEKTYKTKCKFSKNVYIYCYTPKNNKTIRVEGKLAQ